MVLSRPRRRRQRLPALRTFLANQRILCTRSVVLLVVIASLDNADKQMLNSSFPVFERVLGWGTYELGNFSLATNLAYALSLPVWGWLIYRRRGSVEGLQKLLALACGIWGVATIGIAFVAGASDVSVPTSLSYAVSRNLQLLVRGVNGMALGSILPLSQSLLAEYVPDHLLGQAFGTLGVGEKLAGTMASTSIVWFEDSWYFVYYFLGVLSIATGLASRYDSGCHAHAPPLRLDPTATNRECDLETTIERNVADSRSGSSSSGGGGGGGPSKRNLGGSADINDNKHNNDDDDDKVLSFKQIIQKIIRLPAFLCLVAQGVFGGTPWDMMSFLLLLMNWRGFTKDQIVTIQITSGISSMAGGWFGGVMGDYAARELFQRGGGERNNNKGNNKGSRGRIVLALVSVVLGIPLYGLFLRSKEFGWALLWMNLFQLVATWPPSAAIRPICVDLTSGPSERAQIVALWVVLEKISGAVFGAPLVGYLTSRMLADHDDEHENDHDHATGNQLEKAEALAFNLFLLSGMFWGACAFFWFVMLRTTQKKTTHGIIESDNKR